VPNEQVTLVARLGPIDPAREDEDLGRCAVYFEEHTSGLRTHAVSARDGVATVAAAFPASDTPFTIAAKYAGDRQRPRGAQAFGRAFVVTAEKPILLIDADHGLAETEPGTFWVTNNLDVRARAGAVDTLSRLSARYRVVYFSAEGAGPLRYNKLRAWLESSWLPAQRFPDGPLLTAGQFDSEEPDAVRRAVLAALKPRLDDKAVGVSGSAESAQAIQAGGIESFQLDPAAEARDGITVLPAWSDLAKRLLTPPAAK
jgi:hypothetical protein